MKHDVPRGEAEECTVGHMDGDLRGCRVCRRCRRWLRPKDWDAECFSELEQMERDAILLGEKK